ncbi:MAG: ATP-dependent RecD-like DNA helicase, partial [Phascolarctobacterium sp.]|nr:ATP-dependent RecD-like DNA helicase [Candidatus Phascolarctobacterium caballi]
METLEAFLDDIVFQSEDDTYCVLRLRGRGLGRFTAVYHGAAPNVGTGLRLTGSWTEHPRFGKQFAVAECEFVELKKPKRRRKKVNVQASPELVDFLETHGLSATYAERIEKVYRDTALKRIKGDPYCLMRDINGIGFKLADRVAMYLGVERNAPNRVEAGIYYQLEDMGGQGHVCLPEEELIARTARSLGCQPLDVREKYNELVKNDLLRTENDSGVCYVYPEDLYEAEVETSRLLKVLRDGVRKLTRVDVDETIRQWEKEADIVLANAQKEAIYASLEYGVFVLTGGPGTGKTTV